MTISIKSYPRLELEYSLKYIPLNETEGRDIIVYYVTNSTTKVNVTSSATVFSKDTTMRYENGKLYPLREGSALLQAVYNGYSVTQEFVIHDTFFKDNYEMHFITEFDRVNMQTNTLLKIMLDTLFEFFDIGFAYVKDIEGIKNPLKVKAKYLRSLFANFGFPNYDYEHEETEFALFSQETYRNLLNKLLDILEIRGTTAAYELFFGALGYEVDILEFWFDGDENLVEINTTTPENTTFRKYDIFGRSLDEQYQTYEDPRPYVGTSGIQTKYNKSRYIRVLYTKSDVLHTNYSKSLKLIRKYLEYLKPLHLEYLVEMISIEADEDGEEYGDYKEQLNISYVIIIGDDDEPIPIIFSPNGRLLRFTGEASLSIFQFISDGNIMEYGGECEYFWMTGLYTFISDGQILEFINGYLDGISFISNGYTLLFENEADSSYRLLPWDPRTQGPQIGSTIHWYNYLTLYQRENGLTGWVARIPADMYSLDYNTIPASQTYNETVEVTPYMLVEDTIQTYMRFDRGWSYDTGVHWDSFVFMIADPYYCTPNEIGATEVEDYYIQAKLDNTQGIGESNEDYEARIKLIVLTYFNNLNDSGIGLHSDVYDQKISAMS